MLWILAVALPVIVANRYARARLVDFYLASALCRRGRYQQAFERLERFLGKLERKPALARLYPLTTFDSRFGAKSVAGFYRAVCLFEMGRTDEAREGFERIVGEQPDFVECYMNLAGIAVKEGDPDRAAEWLTRAAPYRNAKFVRIVKNAPFLAEVRERPEVRATLTPNPELRKREAVGSIVFWILASPLALWVLVKFVNTLRGVR